MFHSLRTVFLLFFTTFLFASCAGIGQQNPSDPTLGERPVPTYPKEISASDPDAGLRDEIIDYAESLIGTRYRYGGKTLKTGLDCSGYTAYVFKKFGYSLAATSQMQYNELTRVSKKKLRSGDLVFFGNPRTQRVNHVGIYAGDNKILHTSSSRRSVVYADLSVRWFQQRYLGAGRIISD